jgi:excisionase family DNA binding protein
MARKVRELMTALLEEPTLTVDETAVLLSLSRHGAYEGVKSGAIASIRIGRCIRVPCSALREMLGIGPKERNTDRQEVMAVRATPQHV